MAEHTPTPWPEPDYDNSDSSAAEWWEIPGVGTIFDKADAEFIVRAVNSHDELLEALKEAIGLVDEWEYHPEMLTRFEAIIAKADAK